MGRNHTRHQNAEKDNGEEWEEHLNVNGKIGICNFYIANVSKQQHVGALKRIRVL